MNNTERRKARQKSMEGVLDIPKVVVPKPEFTDPFMQRYEPFSYPGPSGDIFRMDYIVPRILDDFKSDDRSQSEPLSRPEIYRRAILEESESLRATKPIPMYLKSVQMAIALATLPGNAKVGEVETHKDDSLEVRLEYNFVGESYFAFYYEGKNLFG